MPGTRNTEEKRNSPLVGDRIIYMLTENGEGMVDELLPVTLN